MTARPTSTAASGRSGALWRTLLAAAVLVAPLDGCSTRAPAPANADAGADATSPAAMPSAFGGGAGPLETVVLDAHASPTPFPHYWERMFGSERAIVSLRESYRRDLRDMKKATGFEFVRFHAIFHDEVGIYDEGPDGHAVYNFSYLDQIYDGLLEDGVRPFVELSFMPRKLAATPTTHAFWYKQYVSPPKNMAAWEALIVEFAKHLVERYGIDEVTRWPFEVWNEPNLDFWAGRPKEATYYNLYDHTARALKRVDPRIRVGGPATAQAAWVDRFIKHCTDGDVPLDFVSTHVYANDTAKDVFGTDENIPRNRMVCRAVKKVRDQVNASSRPDLPLYWSEYNASYKNEPEITDSTLMGPFIADTIRQCDGLVDNLAFWTFSDVFEEQGVFKEPFYGGYGAIAPGGIHKPSFHAFALLHRLGDQRIAVESDSVLATRRADGSLVVAMWNLVLPSEAGADRRVQLKVQGVGPNRPVVVTRVDRDHGFALPAYQRMGSPRYPTAKQLDELRKAAELPPGESGALGGDAVEVSLPPNGLALIEIAP